MCMQATQCRQFLKCIIRLVAGILKVSSQVDGTAGDTSDEDGSDISDDQ